MLLVVLLALLGSAVQAQGLEEYLPRELAEYTEVAQSVTEWLTQTPLQLLCEVWQKFSSLSTQPLQLFLKITILLVLAGLMTTAGESGDKPFLPLVEMVCFLMCALVCISPVQQMIERTHEQILYCKGVLVGFVPVFSGLLAGGGQPASAAVFSGFFLSTALLLAEVAAVIVLPLIRILMALHAAAGVSGISVASSVAKLVQKSIKWGLGLVSTIFGTFLGLQNFLAGASDSLLLKTGKFLIGSSIPIVGQAVSGTITAVSAGMKAAQGTVGIGLMAVLAMCFVPVLLQSVAYWAAFSAAASIADGLAQSKCAALLKAAASCISLCGLTLLFYGLPVVVSVVWMMSSGG